VPDESLVDRLLRRMAAFRADDKCGTGRSAIADTGCD